MSSFESSINNDNDNDNLCILSLPIIGLEYLYIARYILQLSPVPFVLEHISKLESWPSEESQNKLCIILQSILKFPLSCKYIKYFISCLSKNINKNGDIYDDDLMELIIETQDIMDENTQSDSNVGYCGFLLDISQSISLTKDNNNNINMHMNINCNANTNANSNTNTNTNTIYKYANYDIIAIRMDKCHNQVGMKTWGAGIYLAEVLHNHPILLESKRVLELGSGVGQTGLIACVNRKPKPNYNQNHNSNVDIDSRVDVDKIPDMDTCSSNNNNDNTNTISNTSNANNYNIKPPTTICMTDYTDDILCNLKKRPVFLIYIIMCPLTVVV